MEKKCIIESDKERIKYDQKKLVELRRKVNKLYFEEDHSKNKISKEEHVSKDFVIRWTQSPAQNFEEDNRGWKKGKMRKWNQRTLDIVKEIHQMLTNYPSKYFTGATAIAQEWKARYPDEKIPPLRTIGLMLSDLGLSGRRKKGRGKGAAKYLCYPEYTIYNTLGGRVLEADFIEKYIKGRTAPVNFVGFSFKKSPKLRYYRIISGQNSKELTKGCDEFINRFEKPDFIKVDNGSAAIGSASGKRNVSHFMIYLLSQKIIPIFSVPRKPFSQASIEGNNSVFSRFFWNRSTLNDINDVKVQLEWFNKASLKYLEYEKPKHKIENNNFIPRVYFLRQVRENETTGKGYIDVLNESINIRKSYINFFVLAEWNLIEEKLYVHFEREKQLKTIKILSFNINERSKINIKKSGRLLFCQ